MSAFVGGIASALLLGLVARPMASFAGKFGAAENVMAILLAAVCIGKAYCFFFFNDTATTEIYTY